MTNELPNIDDCLKELLIDELDGEEQKRFIDNFQMYLTHGNDNSKYVIDLDKVVEWIGFVAKGTAKRHLKKFFQENVDYVVKKRSCSSISNYSSRQKLNNCI